MSELISGKEALIALVNGEEVEFKDGMEKWENIKHHMNLDLSMFLTAPEWMKFRLKPRTIMIGNIEAPAPFEPKDGEIFYYVSADHEDGYAWRRMHDDTPKHLISLGAWRTEEEIKQVVAALRSIFK